MENLKKRWKINSNWQVIVIILVFAITGSSSALLCKPILHWLGISKETQHILIYISIYTLVIFPIYQILLVATGFLFGQFKFFWAFEKKILRFLKLSFIAEFFEK